MEPNPLTDLALLWNPKLAGRLNRLERRMKMRDFETLLSIGKTLNMSQTADIMAMTQPALSKWLKDLEDLLQVSLFERTTRRVLPTAAGEIVLNHAARMLQGLRQLVDDLESLHMGVSGVVRVGAPAPIAAAIIPPTMIQVLQQGVQLQVHLQEGTIDQLLPLLQRREIDLILGRLDVEALNAGFQHAHLYDGSIYVVARKLHPIRARRSLEWKDTVDYPWIFPPLNSPMHRSLEVTFANASLGMPAAIMSSASAQVNKMIAEETDCLFLASLQTVCQIEKENRLARLPLFLDGIPKSIGMLWNEVSAPHVLAFMAAIRNTAR